MPAGLSEVLRRSAQGRGALPYVLPFAVLIALLGLGSILHPLASYPLRTVCLGLALWICRGAIRLRPRSLPGSILLGVAVFAVWIGPDLLWPGYREHWLFQNAFTRASGDSAPLAGRSSLVFLLFRVAGSVLFVPIAEELFWRGWLMRRLIERDFEKAPLGAYAPDAFWITALLFGSEHGQFWGVGLAAGAAYGWWTVRTRGLADPILAHAVTNACLAVYVLACGRWEYWT